ncbi:MAG: DNA-directed RNA polymerase subunit H [Candidatus Thermoplasmatota archaeon]|nr:DNA-directed RNA polymerase subunit H [Candidatus Thermoplasmatota archaeon]
MAFNVMEHDMVPEHHLLSEKEADGVLAELRVGREQLPKIKSGDPAIRFLEEVVGEPIAEGRVIKVVRLSATAGVFVAYRVVVER